MTMQTTGPLLSDQERTIFRDEAGRKGWQLIEPRVSYSERKIAEMIGGDIALVPEWTIVADARRGSASVTIDVQDSDPDVVRLLFRRMVEGLPDQHGI